ncbi:MAG: DUF4276 family protein [Cyanobacteriota bacterium]|nr:DUF4276 family protein [Cyanobacteriota bacterium]
MSSKKEMINITIYVEGGQGEELKNNAALTVDNSAVFRESFHKLFSQQLSPTKFNLIIQPFGSVTRAIEMLKDIEKEGNNGVILIDLDAPKEDREERLKHYNPFDTTKIFFMIQEMEAWIISQVDKIEEFGIYEGLIRKKANEDIKDNSLIKNKHPEEIEKPSKKLDTILRQYFDVVKTRSGKEKLKGKRYSKAKDGPKLIGLLELQVLMEDFDEAKRLIDRIQG